MEATRQPYRTLKEEGYDGPPPYSPQYAPGSSPPYSPQYAPGTSHTSTTVVVAQPRTVSVIASPPSNYMGLSVVSCCFCWPMAICAIMYSNESSSAAAAGDFGTAREKGQTAMKIALSAIVIGIIIGVVGVVLRVVLMQQQEKHGGYNSYDSNNY